MIWQCFNVQCERFYGTVFLQRDPHCGGSKFVIVRFAFISWHVFEPWLLHLRFSLCWCPRKAVQDGISTWVPPLWETWMEFPAPASPGTDLLLYSQLGREPVVGTLLSVSHFLFCFFLFLLLGL